MIFLWASVLFFSSFQTETHELLLLPYEWKSQVKTLTNHTISFIFLPAVVVEI